MKVRGPRLNRRLLGLATNFGNAARPLASVSLRLFLPFLRQRYLFFWIGLVTSLAAWRGIPHLVTASELVSRVANQASAHATVLSTVTAVATAIFLAYFALYRPDRHTFETAATHVILLFAPVSFGSAAFIACGFRKF